MDSRPPEEVFKNGFQPKDPKNTDLGAFISKENPDSAFVSTSRWDNIAKQFPMKYMYEIDAPGGVDVPKTVGEDAHRWIKGEREVAFPGGLRREYIKAAHIMDYDEIQRRGVLSINNPNYHGGRR